MSRAAVESHTGEGEPPSCEMTVNPVSDRTTPPDLSITAKLKGVKETNKLTFAKEARNVVECVCQVFHVTQGNNRWKTTFAFFPKRHLVVRCTQS